MKTIEFKYEDVVLDKGAPGITSFREGVEPTNYSRIDMRNMKIQEAYPLLEDHNHSEVIGTVEVRKEVSSNMLIGNIVSEKNLRGRFPTIGFEIVEMFEKDGVTTITKCVLQNVSISANPNIDPSIPPLS